MAEENNVFRIVNQISKEQRMQLYILLEEFENECEEKNNDSNLPAKIEKKSLIQRFLSKFKDVFIKLKKYENSKSMAIDILDGKRENSKLFMLCQGEKIVGFEMAQISNEENNRIVGWKPWLYVQKEFRNTNQKFIDENQEYSFKNVTLELDKNVEKWFEKNNVNYEKTSTGINMLNNIVTYIGLGFKPVNKNEKSVFFEKDMRNPLSKQEIRNLIKSAKQGTICSKENIFKQSLKSNLSAEKQKVNSHKFKQVKDIKIHKQQSKER